MLEHLALAREFDLCNCMLQNVRSLRFCSGALSDDGIGNGLRGPGLVVAARAIAIRGRIVYPSAQFRMV